jgi:O-antigen biosynthesis protein
LLFVRDFLTDQTILSTLQGNEAPIISVILPTYRRCRLLERSISSVLGQTFSEFELLVMDDGSADGSNELIERFRAKDSRVVHVRHDRNCGLPALRVNEGIELARGRYIAFQFDDDLWLPNALKALFDEANGRSGEVVAVGKCHRQGAEESMLPYVDLNLINLYHQNRLANNSVLVPRSLFEKYGMYDCHISMRRLCDWDLWLRYIKYVPFVVIDDLISRTFENNPGSIGLTVPWDPPLFRYLQAIPRDHLLTPGHWRDYEVDGLRIGEVEIKGNFRRRLYEDHIVPFYFKFRHDFPKIEGFHATLPPVGKTALLTKASYDVSNDVTLNHYDALTNEHGIYKTYFQPLTQVEGNGLRDVDALLLVRTVEDKAKLLMDQALKDHKPVGFYLDDDLLHFYEFGRQFDYLAPGTPYHDNLSDLLSRADTVWVTNGFIEESVRPFNPRTIPHNNAVPDNWLPTDIKPRQPSKPLRIGYVGSDYRLEEFSHIWEALLRLSKEYGDQLKFEFWGLDVQSLSPLSSPVVQQPFTFSYFNYLEQLKQASFDILLTPLFDYPRPRLAKSLIKYYETAVAGALGIFSDVPQYESLPGGLTCLKTDNTVDGWYQAIHEAITMPDAQFDLMRRRAVKHVREEFTEKAQIHLHEAAWKATEFHAKTRHLRHTDGRPRVMYFLHSAVFGGGELQIWRKLRMARSYGIEPIVVLPEIIRETESAKTVGKTLNSEKIQLEFTDYNIFTEPQHPTAYWNELERDGIRELINRCRPALVHSVTFIPSVGQICTEKQIPHVATLYAAEDNFIWPMGLPEFQHCNLVQSDCLRYAKHWGELLGVEKICARDVTTKEVFALGQLRYLKQLGKPPVNQTSRLRLIVAGTLQERKRQLETIEAVGQLKQEGLDCQLELFGYTRFFPQYLEKCQQRIQEYHIEDRVFFRGFQSDVLDIFREADIVLSLSTHESFPGAIKEAIAAGVLVVATPVGGIPELIIDGVSGILCADISLEAITEGIRRALSLTPAERIRMVEQARRVARSELHPQRAAGDLMTMYSWAMDLAKTSVLSLDLPAISTTQLPSSAAKGTYGVVQSASGESLSQTLIKGRILYLSPEGPNWMGLDVLLNTHQRLIGGNLVLHIFSKAGGLLRETQVDLEQAHDNDWLEFNFTPIANSASIPFRLEFVITDSHPETLISFYKATPQESRMDRLLRKLKLKTSVNTLYYRMRHAL